VLRDRLNYSGPVRGIGHAPRTVSDFCKSLYHASFSGRLSRQAVQRQPRLLWRSHKQAALLHTRDQSECLRWDTVDSHITLSYITQLRLCSAWSMQIFSCMISTVVLTNNQPKAFKNSCFKCPSLLKMLVTEDGELGQWRASEHIATAHLSSAHQQREFLATDLYEHFAYLFIPPGAIQLHKRIMPRFTTPQRGYTIRRNWYREKGNIKIMHDSVWSEWDHSWLDRYFTIVQQTASRKIVK